MYTLLILTLYSVWGLGHGTMARAVVVLQMLISINVIVTIAGGGSSSAEPATMFALAPAAGDMEEVSWAGGGEDAVCCVSLSWC